VEPNWLNVPNAITLVRLLLVPVFIALHATGEHGWALVCFIVAMASDSLDGALARLLHQQTKLGGILDPVADKLLVFTALVALVIARRLPFWVLAVVGARDLLMIIGAAVVRQKGLELPVAPTRIGKYSTFTLACLIVCALSSLTTDSPLLLAYTAVIGFIAALCVVVSTGQYFARFGYLWFAPSRRVR
jgi:cardiolipin synthase